MRCAHRAQDGYRLVGDGCGWVGVEGRIVKERILYSKLYYIVLLYPSKTLVVVYSCDHVLRARRRLRTRFVPALVAATAIVSPQAHVHAHTHRVLYILFI